MKIKKIETKMNPNKGDIQLVNNGNGSGLFEVWLHNKLNLFIFFDEYSLKIENIAGYRILSPRSDTFLYQISAEEDNED